MCLINNNHRILELFRNVLYSIPGFYISSIIKKIKQSKINMNVFTFIVLCEDRDIFKGPKADSTPTSSQPRYAKRMFLFRNQIWFKNVRTIYLQKITINRS